MKQRKIIQEGGEMKILGMEIERVTVDEKAAHKVAYILHSKRVDYRLAWSGNTLYALNSKGNVCGIKGNYTFTVKGGELAAVAGV